MGFWLVIIVLLFFGFQLLYLDSKKEYNLSYSTFIQQVDKGNIAEATQNEREITGRLAKKEMLKTDDGSQQTVETFKVILPVKDPKLIDRIQDKNPNAVIKGKLSGMNWWGAILTYLPFILIIAIWVFFLRQMQSGGNKAFSFGKSKAKLIDADRPTVTFLDVAGCDEAKQELEEVVEFLKSPRKFQRLGGRVPKGALLVGPPGTGKTLLGRAVAGEAGVPFFHMSGSDFVEMFVGVGASRVRDLFEQGKRAAPCILFIDEIDAVGRHRGAGLGGGHDEREQTLNQLLVEMDGFESNDGVILIAATNRPDVLDPALLRPGRFDRQVMVDLPDIRGREGILKVHMRKVQVGPDVDTRVLAKGTPGMSGADLANLVNEGALLAARRGHEVVTMLDMEDAKEKVLLGPERRSRVMSPKELELTAYHECGHAIVAASIPDYDQVHKITIIPRGRAAGLTWVLPDEDRIPRLDWAEARIAHALGGRAAEELIFDMISAGASDDIQKATELARRMVTRWGMSQLGPIALAQQNEQIFLGREISQHRDYSEKTAIAIDDEISRLIRESHDRAKNILSENIDALHKMAKALLERETLDGADVNMILKGEELPPLAAPEPLDEGEPAAPPPNDSPAGQESSPTPKGLHGQPGPDPAL
ncbi:MAG TPA: ATP-dependent zinc metalloprotease FtsH [Candidatus Krumholzibacteria bacterium]|nr:ATP-dependent zinc metalloprotease FtsH [Candidatus Krumholzibacteria bacterium]